MDVTATDLIVRDGAIPIHWLLFEGLSVLTLVLHLVLMNSLVGGSAITLVEHFRNGSGNLISKDMRGRLPVLMAFTINFGIAPLLFLQVVYGAFAYTSQILMASFVLGIIGLLIVGYYSIYMYSYKAEKWGGISPLVLIAALLTVLTTGFIFSNIMTMMLTPERWLAYHQNGTGTLLAVDDPTFLPKFLHMIVGAIAIGGLFIAFIWRLKKPETDGRAQGISLGLQWFRYATLVQILMGIWFLLSLPDSVRNLFIGGNIIATSIFWASIAAALLALHYSYLERVFMVAGFALTTVVLMVINRAFMRGGYLGIVEFSPEGFSVEGEITPFILFIVILVIGLACVAWMVLAYAKAGKEA